MDNDMRLSRIRQIAITVSDVSAALDFYRGVLKLEFLFSPREDMAFLSAGDVRIYLTSIQESEGPIANSILYFAVDDIEEAHSVLLTRGAQDERGPILTATMSDHELWTAFVRDPDGNLIGLMEERFNE